MKLKLRTKLIAVCLLASLAIAGDLTLWSWLKQPGRFPILSVKVAGRYDYIGAPLIQQTLTPYVEQGLFGLNKKAARNALMQVPAVQTASIVRELPYTLLVTVQQRKAVVRWNDGSLMTADGVFFIPTVEDSGDQLPLFVGQQQNQKQMLSQFYQFQKALNKAGLNITTLWYTDSGSWQIQVDQGFWIYLGTTNMQDLLNNFLVAYPVMMANATPGANLTYVDLRYHNGFAAKWSNPPKSSKTNPTSTVTAT
ncbi:MAG: cell division protein FtsQ/DivIB [Gammaproteobacteria bacterium]|jgi:cell division protein FtsQ|nr:cell division protein FtsQ/DivIB [Gammaproteobacteria bacterium]